MLFLILIISTLIIILLYNVWERRNECKNKREQKKDRSHEES